MGKGNKGISESAKEQRRQEAQARQAAYDTLTTEQKLKALGPDLTKATKQRDKLEARLQREKEAKEVEARQKKKKEEKE